jgi:hypothetical protein
MAARILHFGCDSCYRVLVLRQAGYAVAEADSLIALDLHLRRKQPVSAVIFSDDSPRTIEKAAELVRQRTPAPLILFRDSQLVLDEKNFDRVYSEFVAPDLWLRDTSELIARSQH